VSPFGRQTEKKYSMPQSVDSRARVGKFGGGGGRDITFLSKLSDPDQGSVNNCVNYALK
jgi:hypothetical protein